LTLLLLPGSKNMIGANLELVSQERREFRLREAIEAVRDAYPFIVLDCPPALDLLTLNALVAADGLLVPMQAEYFALEGISELMQTLDRVAQAFNPTLALEGVLLTMYDDRTNLSQQVTENLRVLRREAAEDDDSAQYPAGGGAQPRQAGAALRPALARRGGVHRAGLELLKRNGIVTKAASRSRSLRMRHQWASVLAVQ
jgi:chromosome partitioning protein